jgi:tripartite-type tricarboxylate transporter receptor subunit TctC
VSSDAHSAAGSQKPTRIVVPFSAGADGSSCVSATKRPGKRLEQVVVVDNKPGAGTVIGVDSVAKAPPDGIPCRYREQLHRQSHLVANLPYRSLEDLRPVTLLTRTPNVLVGRPTLGPRTLAELIAAAKTTSLMDPSATARFNTSRARCSSRRLGSI